MANVVDSHFSGNLVDAKITQHVFLGQASKAFCLTFSRDTQHCDLFEQQSSTSITVEKSPPQNGYPEFAVTAASHPGNESINNGPICKIPAPQVSMNSSSNTMTTTTRAPKPTSGYQKKIPHDLD